MKNRPYKSLIKARKMEEHNLKGFDDSVRRVKENGSAEDSDYITAEEKIQSIIGVIKSGREMIKLFSLEGLDPRIISNCMILNIERILKI